MVFKQFTPEEKKAYGRKQAALKNAKPVKKSYTKGKSKFPAKGKKTFIPNYK